MADRVWRTVSQPDDANVVCIAGDERAMLVDAGGTPEVGAAVLASARELVGLPLEHVVITHQHHDHWHGIAGMTGVETIAHESIVSDDTPAELRPSRTFSLVVPLNLGGRFIEIVHFGHAHTPSDIVVVASDPDVAVVGDLLESAGDPQFDEDSKIGEWAVVLDSVLGATKRDTVFVPGHGEPQDREFAVLQRAEIEGLYSTAYSLIERGVRLEDAYDEAEWPFSVETQRRALPLVYDQLAAQGVRPRTQLPIRGV